MRIPNDSPSSLFPGDPLDLPIRSAEPPPYSAEHANLSLHPSLDESATGLLVKVTPPREPMRLLGPRNHMPCDIVLVIDVSASMGSRAPVPGPDSEDYGYSVLDLTKHAASTILETMDEGDSLGLVTFSGRSTIVQKLEPTTDANKKLTQKKINSLKPASNTNLWLGIKSGLEVISARPVGPNRRVSALMVLTDGMPNVDPPQGYLPKLKSMFPLPAPIHTFGFGNELRSGLLKTIADVTGGGYAFIPDAGMLGTVFIHAVANLQSTFAESAVLSLVYPPDMKLQTTTGDSVVDQDPVGVPAGTQLRIPLGSLLYGQSRDVWLSVECGKDLLGMPVAAQLEYAPAGLGIQTTVVQATMLDPLNLERAELAYHQSRSMICKFLSSIHTHNKSRPDDEYKTILANEVHSKAAELADLVSRLPSKHFDDDFNKALIRDLVGEDPDGQVAIALSTRPQNGSRRDHFSRWGQHYLPSLQSAHLRQICNSFKDPGPLKYGVDSPLFLACRTALDTAFESLQPPEPSLPDKADPILNYPYSRAQQTTGTVSASVSRAPQSMSLYHSRVGVCFAGSTQVKLASGSTKPVRALRRDDEVETPAGTRRVTALLKTWVRRAPMSRISELLVTPHHPISVDAKMWDFPDRSRDRVRVRFTGFIYSVMLQADDNSAAHAIKVGGVWGVTLGHGLTGRVVSHDVRGHTFFGNYAKVSRALDRLDVSPCGGGVYEAGGVKRHPSTKLVVGFSKVKKEEKARRRARQWASMASRNGNGGKTQVARAGPEVRLLVKALLLVDKTV